VLLTEIVLLISGRGVSANRGNTGRGVAVGVNVGAGTGVAVSEGIGVGATVGERAGAFVQLEINRLNMKK